MSKPPATWKHWEAKIAAVFGLKRRGADYGDKSGGKNDAVEIDGSESQWWSLEVKHGKRIPNTDTQEQLVLNWEPGW